MNDKFYFQINAGPNSYNESETIAKYEIMDGAPVRGNFSRFQNDRTVKTSRELVVRKKSPVWLKFTKYLILSADQNGAKGLGLATE